MKLNIEIFSPTLTVIIQTIFLLDVTRRYYGTPNCTQAHTAGINEEGFKMYNERNVITKVHLQMCEVTYPTFFLVIY